MARRFRIPLLIDVVRVDAPETIRALPAHDALDRDFKAKGPLVNRLIMARLRRMLRTTGDPLPTALPRGDQARAAAQAALTARLSEGDPDALLDDETLDALATYVRGDGGAVGPLTQQLLGRLFREDYRATDTTWAAAERLQDAIESNNPLKHLFWALTGRIPDAQRTLTEAAGGGPAAVHATAIAVHNLVDSITCLAALYARPAERAAISMDEVIARALVGPRSVVRQAARDSDSLVGRLGNGTLAVFSIREAGERSLDPRVIFMAGSWSECPAHGLVPKVIAAVWSRALER